MIRNSKLVTSALFSFCLIQLIAQQSDLQIAIDQVTLAKEKSVKYIEDDSIFILIASARNTFALLGEDSMLFETTLDLAYWHSIQADRENTMRLSNQLFRITKGPIQKRRFLIWMQGIYCSNFYDRDSCSKYSELSLSSLEGTEDYLHLMIAINQKIDFYLNNPDSLEKIPALVSEALQYEFRNQATMGQAHVTRVNWARYLLKTSQYQKAVEVLQPMSEMRSDFATGFTVKVKELLIEAYESMGDFQHAFYQSRQVILLADTLANRNRHDAIQRAKYAFASESDKQRIADLEVRHELQKKIADRRNTILFIIVVASMALLGLLFTAYHQSRKSARSEHRLVQYERQVTKMKSKLFTNITHEFRTPLTVILGMAAKIKGNVTEKTLIQRNGNQLLNLVNQLLDIAKAESGTLSLDMQQADIISFLEYLVESFLSLAEKKQIRLMFHSEVEQLFMDFDSEKIKHIFSNLLANAIKFTQANGKVLLLADRLNDQLQIRVKDNGIGIDPAEQEDIFERFYQSEQHNLGGSGIGLALVKEFVELMRGSISVTSSPGQGAEFKILLPIKNEALRGDRLLTNPTETAKPILDEHTQADYQNDQIALVVEDNDDVMTYIESCIHHEYRVEKARNGQAGLELAQQLIPDIIISDIMMPVMDGLAMTEVLKKDFRTSHIPIIILTAKATQEERLEGLSTGADAYLVKPFNEEELQIRIKQLIALRMTLKDRYKTDKNWIQQLTVTDPFIVRLSEILEESYMDESLTVSELCTRMHLSRMQVHRKIKALTGQGTRKFINDFRLNKAEVLLRNEALNVSEVAYACGYSDPGYFSKLFKEKYGVSPSQKGLA